MVHPFLQLKRITFSQTDRVMESSNSMVSNNELYTATPYTPLHFGSKSWCSHFETQRNGTYTYTYTSLHYQS